jgi:hypothetical protein
VSIQTSSAPWLTTPRAILLGAFVIGAFAYVGLRNRSATMPDDAGSASASLLVSAVPSTSSPSGATSTAGSSGELAATPTFAPVEPALSAAPVTDRSTIEAAARKALAEHLPALKQSCWTARPPEARVRLMMNLSFDRTGAQIARGLSEPRLPDEQRAWLLGLGPCISEKLPPLSIDPPGASVQVEIPIDFP